MRLVRVVSRFLRRLADPNAGVCDCSEWRQADVFTVDGVWTTGENGKPTRIHTRLGVAAISQSCDAAQSSRDRLHVSPVVRLKADKASAAAAGKFISYAALPELGPDYYADLETVITVPKVVLADAPRTRGVVSDEHVRRFAGSVARKYGRFAFPDDVVKALDPLRDVLRSKARKEQSPLGRILSDIYAIRVEATSGWESAPYELQLVAIFWPGVVPEFDDGAMPTEPAGLRDRVLGKDKPIESRVNEIATEYWNDATTPEAKYWLIWWLVESWSAQCEKAARAAGVDNVVQSVVPDVATVDDFPLSRYNNSEDLDLDYLSEPLPRGRRKR